MTYFYCFNGFVVAHDTISRVHFHNKVEPCFDGTAIRAELAELAELVGLAGSRDITIGLTDGRDTDNSP